MFRQVLYEKLIADSCNLFKNFSRFLCLDILFSFLATQYLSLVDTATFAFEQSLGVNSISELFFYFYEAFLLLFLQLTLACYLVLISLNQYVATSVVSLKFSLIVFNQTTDTRVSRIIYTFILRPLKFFSDSFQIVRYNPPVSSVPSYVEYYFTFKFNLLVIVLLPFVTFLAIFVAFYVYYYEYSLLFYLSIMFSVFAWCFCYRPFRLV